MRKNIKQQQNKQIQAQESILVSAYEKKVVQDVFFGMMEVLEKYIEKANYYPQDWQVRKKIYDNKVTREFVSVEEAESVLLSNLLGLKIVVKNKPDFLISELKEEYRKWIDATGINVDNISPQAERLKHLLIEINEILEGRGEKFVQEVAKESREHVRNMGNEEYERKMNEAFGSYNVTLNKEREIENSLEGKSYKDIDSEKKFDGADDRKGEQAFNRIVSTVSNHDKFSYYRKNSQQRTNSEIIQDIRQNPRNWRFDEVITEYDGLGKATKKETALIHSSAEIGFDGAVSDAQQPVYLAQRFNQSELVEINQSLNISQTPTYDGWTREQFIAEIERLKAENEALKNNQTLTSSEKQRRLQHNQQKLEKLEKSFPFNELDNSLKYNNLPTNLFIGGTVLAVIGLISFLLIRKHRKNK